MTGSWQRYIHDFRTKITDTDLWDDGETVSQLGDADHLNVHVVDADAPLP